MKSRSKQLLLSVAATSLAGFGVLSLASCDQTNLGDAPAGSDGWLTGHIQQKFDTLAEQHQGFSRTMIEVGYRYTELYWAGEDENWEFAEYQIEHIAEAMELGIQRRPARGRSAEMFMNHALPAISQAVEQRDRHAFREQFQNLAMHCNACHAMEDVGFIHVRIPTERHLPWGAGRAE